MEPLIKPKKIDQIEKLKLFVGKPLRFDQEYCSGKEWRENKLYKKFKG